jgi:transcriptional regulator with XRE-family HTH domain
MSEEPITPSQVKAARALLGWSQRELAQRAGVAQSTIADYERGFQPIQNNLQAMLKSLQKEGIGFSEDGGVRGNPPGRSPTLPKGWTPFRFIDETDLRQ